ncbi:MAG: hypothetical protein HOM58_07085 [Rhodospirillaceae bacterium]|jgi:hypothetical protein|nr:hypothetical protein [Rhodospirillaceae bacterium]MBT5458551.1 hypothetical protein [Rhodospirillaceae bacterium]
MRSYELQSFQGGKWMLDSVYDDRTFALEEAKRADAAGRYSGVRLIEEDYDDATNQTTTRTLFRGGAAKGQKALNPVSNKKSSSAASRGATGREPPQRGGRINTVKKSSFLVPVLVLLTILIGALAAFFGLQYLSVLS